MEAHDQSRVYDQRCVQSKSAKGEREREEGEQENERRAEGEGEREREGMKERKRRVAFDRFAAWKLAWKQRIEATRHATGKRDKRFLYDFTSMLVEPFFKTVFYIYST